VTTNRAQPSKRRRVLRLIAIGVGVVIILLFVGGLIFLQPATLGVGTQNALRSSQEVQVSDLGDFILFYPMRGGAKVGLVFYPGGRVPVEAYATHLNQIAAAGYATITREEALSQIVAATLTLLSTLLSACPCANT
jgi:Tfp pilus assembly protein PilN